MGIRVDVSLARSFPRITDGILAGVVNGQNKAAEELLKWSAAEVPYQQGDLAETGTVVRAEIPGDDAEVVYDSVYAARWHEDQPLVDSLGRRYNGKSDFGEGRKSHYLSDPALQHKAELGKIIATEANRVS
ncbi:MULTISPECIES: hypothetical protein [unclassified Cryobacterium]|uniref:hypothetical protein n=1 Tax=unclassified Cryobacterium TaxID=2649013 RepID=UPI00106C774F|nr:MULTISPECIES: hypothetical protein [unclassified Cryobacterium]TFC59409.1 hypothetical protein E3O68_00475 [Cryobacterium sp. TMB3-1-2]TFC67205.1 hypothetical protein E3T21_17170 [Cryobacterium sp. TMB3-15]TFC73282.1 hypothetical protein E3T22_16885 [Cryobacterium sp. TMB3-10]TFD46170.1 hypothetical protein E3T58_01520 [Cryobacterium sp. TMB3-12]